MPKILPRGESRSLVYRFGMRPAMAGNGSTTPSSNPMTDSQRP